MRTWRRIGLFVCSLGWHRRPFERGLPADGVTPEDDRFSSRYYCRRCGLTGRLDVHGNLDPDGAS